MDSNFRPSGFEGLGDMSWGIHFCLFYETEQDLLETLAGYFRTGLANHEFCLWITPNTSDGNAWNALRQVIPSADQHLEEGHIEILPCQQWYCEDDTFDGARVIEAFDTKLAQALENGYTRMRVLADEAWLDQERWDAFSDYEAKIDERFAGKPVNIVCAYPTASHNAADILDVAQTHQFIIAKRKGNWEILEAPELKHVQAKSERLDEEVNARVAEQEKFDTSPGLQPSGLVRYTIPIIAVVLSLAGTFLLQPYVFRTLLFFLSIMISTWVGGIGPGLLAVFLSTLAINVFLSPAGILETHYQNVPNVISFLITALLVGSWSETRRRAEHSLRKARDELEGKVQERMASLRQLNQAMQVEIIDHKRSEEALRTNEYRLQAAINAADIGLWDWDLVSRQIIWLGHHAKLFGFAPGEFDGTYASFEKRIHPEDLEELNRVVQHARQERSEYAHEYRVVWPDGSIHWIAGRGRFIYNEAGKPVRMYGAVLDITERKRTEEDLRKYELIVSHTPDGISLVDKDYRYQSVNAAYEKFSGVKPEQLVGRTIAEYLGNQVFEESIKPNFDRCLRGEIISYQEWFHYPTLGKRFIDVTYFPFIDAHNQIAGVVAMSRDITKRKQTEEALQQSQERLQVALQAAQIGTGEWDIQADRISASNGLERIFGFAPGTFNPNFAEFVERVYPEDREMLRQTLERAMAGKTGYTLDFRVAWPDGSIHWITSRNLIFYNDAGEPTRLVGAAMDITERKQAEEEIRRYAARVEALAEISHTFAEAGLDYQGVLNTVARRIAELIGDLCVIISFSDNGKQNSLDALYHPDPRALELIQEAFRQDWQGNRQRVRKLLSNEPLYLPVVDPEQFRPTQDPVFWPYFDEIGISSVLCVPLQIQGKVIGTLGIIRDRSGRPYTPEDRALLQDLADRAALTIQNARLFQQVEGAREQLGALSKRLLEVQESERRALNTELHDRVGQNLTGLSIILQNMKTLLSNEAAQTLAANFDDAQALVEDTTRQIRDILAELHLPELEDYGLAAALETYAERVASRGNLDLIADLPDLADPSLPSEVRIALFRAAQEAISNVLKHADATQLIVSLHGENGRVHLRVEDDGRGFDPDAALEKEAPSWGLKIMQERIESIGGKIQIESRLGQGTQVTFEIERTT